jgi:hypothetical protein
MDELRMVTPRAQGVEPCIGCEHGERHLHDTLLDIVWEGWGETTQRKAEAGSLHRELASGASRGLPRFRRAVRRYGTCQSQLRVVATRVRSRLSFLGRKAARIKTVQPARPEVFTSFALRAGGLLQPRFFPQPGDAKPQRSAARSIPTSTARSVRSLRSRLATGAIAYVNGERGLVRAWTSKCRWSPSGRPQTSHASSRTTGNGSGYIGGTGRSISA